MNLKNKLLDKKDKKILNLLSYNSRIPLTQLVKKVNLSRDAINYRINNYEKMGLIEGYRTIVDISKFDYINCHLFIRLHNPETESEEKILKKISDFSFIRAIWKFNGIFDIEVALVAKNLADLDEKITLIMDNLSGIIQDHEILIITKELFSFPLPYSFTNEKIKELIVDNKDSNFNINNKDIEILKIIGENANIPLYEIADKLKISADAVSYRIKNMIKNNIIRKFVPSFNYSVLNYNLYAILINIESLNEDKEKIFREFLIQDDNVIWAVKTIGRYNFIVYLLAEKTEDMQRTIIKLRSIFSKQINRYHNLIAYKKYKYVYFPKNLFKSKEN